MKTQNEKHGYIYYKQNAFINPQAHEISLQKTHNSN